MLLHQRDKVFWLVASQRGFAEVRIGGKKIFRPAMQVGKIAPSATGNQNFLPDTLGAFEQQYAAAALSGLGGAHQAGRAAAENNDVEGSLAQKELPPVVIISAIRNYSAVPVLYAPLP